MNDNSDYELYHYGIKGMKWGVRRSRDQLRRSRGPKGKSEVDNDPATKKKKSSTTPTREDISKMSDDELRKKINRIRMEMEYVKLTSPPPSQTRTVKKMISKAVEEEYKNVAKAAVHKIAKESIKSAMNKK